MDVPLPRAICRLLTSFLIFHISMLASPSTPAASEDMVVVVVVVVVVGVCVG